MTLYYGNSITEALAFFIYNRNNLLLKKFRFEAEKFVKSSEQILFYRYKRDDEEFTDHVAKYCFSERNRKIKY